MEIRTVFVRKIGPLPAWAWGVIVGAGLIGWQLWRRRQLGEGTEDLEDGETPAAAAGEYLGDFGGEYIPPSSGGAAPEQITLPDWIADPPAWLVDGPPGWLDAPPAWWETPPVYEQPEPVVVVVPSPVPAAADPGTAAPAAPGTHLPQAPAPIPTPPPQTAAPVAGVYVPGQPSAGGGFTTPAPGLVAGGGGASSPTAPHVTTPSQGSGSGGGGSTGGGAVARPASGTILWRGQNKPNLATVAAAHNLPVSAVDDRERGGGLGWVVVVR